MVLESWVWEPRDRELWQQVLGTTEKVRANDKLSRGTNTQESLMTCQTVFRTVRFSVMA